LEWDDFAPERDDRRQLFGFPGGWAHAMRDALAEVGVPVTLSQAQEAVAVFFGAGSWHQLVKHQDLANAALVPVGIEWQDVDGASQLKYFWTPEEALFAVGKLVERSAYRLRVQYFSSTLSSVGSVAIALCPARVVPPSASELELLDLESCVRMPADEYVYEKEDDEGETTVTMRAARELLAAAERDGCETGSRDTLYVGEGVEGLLKGIMLRNGIPASHVVLSHDNACAVGYETVNDEVTFGALLYVYERKGESLRATAIVSMYKAKLSIAEDRGGYSLIIRGDYGHDAPIVVGFDNREQLNKLLGLVYAEGVFCLVGRLGFPLD
jgi:hypothetical protein